MIPFKGEIIHNDYIIVHYFRSNEGETCLGLIQPRYKVSSVLCHGWHGKADCVLEGWCQYVTGRKEIPTPPAKSLLAPCFKKKKKLEHYCPQMVKTDLNTHLHTSKTRQKKTPLKGFAVAQPGQPIVLFESDGVKFRGIRSFSPAISSSLC